MVSAVSELLLMSRFYQDKRTSGVGGRGTLRLLLEKEIVNQ